MRPDRERTIVATVNRTLTEIRLLLWDKSDSFILNKRELVPAFLQTKYPDYCTLNLCRIMYSLKSSDIVVSKEFSGMWATEQYPQWSDLIAAATCSYDGTASKVQVELMTDKLPAFHEFATLEIDNLRNPEDRTERKRYAN